jgi:hypothetical protein
MIENFDSLMNLLNQCLTIRGAKVFVISDSELLPIKKITVNEKGDMVFLVI